MKRLALIALLLQGAMLVVCGAARAEGAPVRLPALTPKGSIDAAGLRHLAELDRVRGPRRLEKEGEGSEFEPNEYEEPMIEPGRGPTFVPASPLAPKGAQSFSYAWGLRRSFPANRSNGGTPMDGSLAAGPAHLVSMTNTHIAFYTHAGDSVGGASFANFFPYDSRMVNLFDPRVEYDPGSGRFFAMILAVSGAATRISAFELAVSNGSDPTQGWTFYEVRSEQDGLGIDYPYMGFGAGALYLSGNYRDKLFGWPVGSPAHANGLWVIDKAALLAATTAAVWRFTDIFAESHYVTVEACARWSTPPSGLDDFLITFEGIDPESWRVHVWGVTLPSSWPGVSPLLDRHSYTTPALGAVPNAKQRGGPALLQANNVGSPPCLSTFINGHIHTALHAPSGTGLFIRHYDTDVSGWTSVSGITDDFWDGSSYHYYPSVAVNPWGDVGLVYSRSSTSEYASAIWAFRPQDEVFYQGGQTLKAGEAYYGNATDVDTTTYRWGDYSGAAIDPVTGGLWFLNMYASAGSGSGPVQATWIGYVPHAVFVDAGYVLFHSGSRTYPWNQFLDGYNSAWNENDLVLKAGSYHAGRGVLGKPLTVKSDGGTATITP